MVEIEPLPVQAENHLEGLLGFCLSAHDDVLEREKEMDDVRGKEFIGGEAEAIRVNHSALNL